MDDYLVALDAELKRIVVESDPVYKTYYGMFRYHLGWVDAEFRETITNPGKRIRPLLCLLACEALCGDWQRAIPAATAIELAHNFSLIHDDIEDQSDERRGRAAVWKLWGLAQGLNAGDGMFVLARLALDQMLERGYSALSCSEISRVFDQATLALCHGQFLDLGFEARLDVSVDEYMQMIRGKTAALISAATRIGAMLATDDAKMIDAFARFGENIGIAFQITDDILGIWGDPAVTGKSAATDILSKKKSLPALYGLNHPQHGDALRTIYRKPELDERDVACVLDLLDAAATRKFVEQRADEYRAHAIAALDAIGIANNSTQLLRNAAELMTRRVK
jgi:geranylgeranyl diphosphate synthase, type I